MAHSQTTIGADLNKPINTIGGQFGANGVNCPETIANYFEGQLPALGPFPATPTCTWTSGAEAGLLVPSGVGVISSVSLRTGPATGPMRITVMTAARHAQSTVVQCCFFKSESDVFVPGANAVATIPAALPVSNTLNRVANTYNFDMIGLTVLDANATIPLHIQVPDSIGRPFSTAYYPHMAPSATDTPRVDGGGAGGTTLLMNATWQSCGAAATGRARAAAIAGCPPGSTLRAADTVRLRSTSVRVRRRRANLRIRCIYTSRCRGTVRLENRKRATAARKSKRRTYARARFSIAAGKTKTVKAKLNRRGRKLVRRKKARAWANIKLSKPAIKEHVAKRVKFKR